MKCRAKQLLEEALKLSPKKRALLGAELLRSVHDDSPEEVEAAWRDEIMCRIDDVERGEAKTEDWGEVYSRLRAKLAAEANDNP